MFMWKNYIKVGVVLAVLLLLFGTAHAQDNPTGYAWVEKLTANIVEVHACNLDKSGYAAFIQQNFSATHTTTGENKDFDLVFIEKVLGCYTWIGNWSPWRTGNYMIWGEIDDANGFYYTFSKEIGINQLKLFFSIITFWR